MIYRKTKGQDGRRNREEMTKIQMRFPFKVPRGQFVQKAKQKDQ